MQSKANIRWRRVLLVSLATINASLASGCGWTGPDTDAVGAGADVLSGRVAHWPMNEGTGTTVADVSGNGNHGTLQNGARWLADNTLGFDGSDDYVNVGNVEVTGSALTISAWFLSTDLDNCRGQECRIISKADGVSGSAHHFMISTIARDGATRLRFRLKLAGRTHTLIASSGDIAENEWTHVAAVYDGSTMRLYKDGSEVGRLSRRGAVASAPDVPCWIGGNPVDATARPWRGRIKDVRLYDRALSSGAVGELVAPSGNQPPTAHVGNDQHVHLPAGQTQTTVTLDGSRSTDDDGSIVAYRWSGNPDPADTISPNVTLPAGTHTFTLEVEDNEGARASAQTTIVVEPAHDDGHDDAHTDDPAKQTEHQALLDLVPRSGATHTAVRDGAWNEPSTWSTGEVPGSDARVVIPTDQVVTLTHEDPQRLFTVRVDGTLRFAPDQNTAMRVDSLIVDVNGRLEIGTLAAPIQSGRTARIVITDRGAIDTTWDRFLLSRGILSHGSSSIVGAPKSSYVIAARDPRAGSTTLELSTAPVNWQPGDRLLIPGVRKPTATRDEDEIVAIRSMQGTTVTLTEALKYDHAVPRADIQKVPVANMDRNVIVESENKTTPARAGHVMYMHNDDVVLQYARFLHMGRNDKSIPTTDPRLDSNGRLVPSTGANPRARYAVHFHRTGVNRSIAAHVKGCVVERNPGWGFVNHDSHVVFEDNVAYDTFGTGFVTEIGNETGAFIRNLSVRSKISTRSVGFGGSDGDDGNGFGSDGHGFWMQSPGVQLIDNIASGHGQEAFFFHGLFRKNDRSHYEFDLANVIAGVVTNASGIKGNRVKTEDIPLETVRGNHAFGSGTGYAVRWRRMPNVPTSGQGGNILEDFQIWNVTYKGMAIGYSAGMIFRNGIVLGDVDRPIPLSSRERSNPVVFAGEEEGLTGRGISSNGNVHDVRYENINIEGFTIGIQATSGGETGFTNLTLRNVINIRVLTPQETMGARRRVYASGIVNLPLSSAALNGATQYNVYLLTQLQRTGIAGGGTVDQEFGNHTAMDEIYYNGKRLYYYEQRPTAVPFRLSDPPYLTQFPTAHSAAYIDKYGDYFEKTNQQLMSQFGRTLGGVAAPSNATDGRSDGIFGMVEDNVATPAPNSPFWMPISQPAAGHTYSLGQREQVIAWESTGFPADTVWQIRLHSASGKTYVVGDRRFSQFGAIRLVRRDASNDSGTHTWSFTWPRVGSVARFASADVPAGLYSMLIGPYRSSVVGFVPMITLE